MSALRMPVPMSEEASWRSDAACIGVATAIFYPGSGESATAARAVCSSCPVRLDCLEEALRNHEVFGVWGGTTEKERRKMKPRRR